jgi:hypothetical protein
MKKNTPQIAVNTGKLFFPGAGDGGYADRLKAEAKAEKDALSRAKALAKLVKDQAANQAKILKDKRLQNAIDKANLALNKGGELFDLDKVQIAAALANQAEQLGKATSSAQVLAIANDIARLNVKKSISDLEDAIASKDQAAIEAATKKLNEDLKILNTLGQQNVKLMDIKSILDTLVPKDLINLQNLKDAIALLGQIKVPSLGSSAGGGGGGGFIQTPNGISPTTPARTVAEINNAVADLGLATTIGDNGIEFTSDQGMLSGVSPNGREYNFTVNVNTGIGDPNAIAEAINEVLNNAYARGTLATPESLAAV